MQREPAEAEEEALLLQDCLRKLPQTDRELICRRYDAGVSVKVLAADLHLPPNTVAVRLHRIRRSLLECVQQGFRIVNRGEPVTTPLPQPEELHELLIALSDGELSGEQFARLQQLLRQDPAAQAYYRQYMRLCALLEFERAAGEGRMRNWGRAGMSALQGCSDVRIDQLGNSVRNPTLVRQSLRVPDAPAPEPLIPPIIIDPSPAIHSPLFTIHSLARRLAVFLRGRHGDHGHGDPGGLGCTRCPMTIRTRPSGSSRRLAAAEQRPAKPETGRPDHGHGRLPLGRSARRARPRAVPLGGKYALASGPDGNRLSTPGPKSFSKGHAPTKSIPPAAASSRWAS